MNRTHNSHGVILLIFVALFCVQCDTNYYEQYLPENQAPAVNNMDVPQPQNVPTGAVPQDAYYIQLSMSENYAAVQKVAREYQNYGYTPLIFYTPDSKYIVIVEGGKNQVFAWNQQRKMRSRNQLPSDSKIIKLQPDWTGPMFIEVPGGQNAISGTQNPYFTAKPNAPASPEIQNYAVEPNNEPPGQKLPSTEPKVYDITNEKSQPEGTDTKPATPQQSIYDMVRGFFNPTSSSDTVQTAQLDRYLLVAGKGMTLKKAKELGGAYVSEGFAVFIWEKADGTYSIVIGEPDTEESCEAMRVEVSQVPKLKKFKAGSIEEYSQEWLRVVFP